MKRIDIEAAVAVQSTLDSVSRLAALGCILYAGLGPAPGLLHAASTIQFSAGVYFVTEGTSQVDILVQRSEDVEVGVGVKVATADITAKAGADYVAVTTNLTFAAGETSHTIAVPILNDAQPDSTEYFSVVLSNPTGGAVLGTLTNATVRIKPDGDQGLAFEFGNYAAREDAGFVEVGIVRGDDGDFPVTVVVGTANGVARAGADYTGITNTLTFAPGERLQLLAVEIQNDAMKESPKAFSVTLSSPGGGSALGSPSTASVKIVDNDPGVRFDRQKSWVLESEGEVRLTVERGNDQALDAFTVDYASADGTAEAGSDYAETQGTLSFAAGQMKQTLRVPIRDDGVAERDERFSVVLSSPTGGQALGAWSSTTITVCDVHELRPHSFDAVRVFPDGAVALTLGGGVIPNGGLSNRFQPYFDIYPLETSSDLVHWTPLTWVVRTNASPASLVYTDARQGQDSQRFYRLPSRQYLTPNPPPTGPYAVGREERWVTDPTRRNRYMVSTNASFHVTLWYPAIARPGAEPLPCGEAPVWDDTGYWGLFTDRIRHFVEYAAAGLEIAPSPVRHPVVVMSSGATAVRHDWWQKADELASQGYVVVAPEHYDAWGVVLADGTYSSGDRGEGFTEAAGIQDRVRDLAFVLDQLEQWNASDPVFADRLDLSRIAALGFSWGGTSAAEFCRVDPRCRAVVALDPSYVTRGVSWLQPTLTICSSEGSDDLIYSQTKTDAIWFRLRNAVHGDMGGLGWFPSGTPAAAKNAQEISRTADAFMVWFLNKHLKGSTEPMPELSHHPRIMDFRQK